MNNDIRLFIGKFLDLPEEIITVFENLVEYTELPPMSYLAKTGEYSTDFFIVKSGIVRSYYLNNDGKENTRALFIPGYVTGPTSAMMRNIPSELNYQTLTKVTGYRGNFHELIKLTEKHHELALFYVKTLEDAFLKAEKIILDISTLNATERYTALREKIPNIDNILAQKYIASYLNITPVQLSRIRKKMYL
ncbi:hypothetical protein WH52_07540 [Tenacibaculum holothuriorum]|uniref:Cyclic nucleotide-binding domain-containing protein n=1 Tax=Tenacibaculum holothuriorum TaxID=1635173 RepID=A0A1Y2PDL3_9FLAO|nr:Crp/Fnr family transcriptional regulator [Tenacibaculum holothuriorum]OSY87887.1 hypothetical protein WH52_07540 [Tenacibaculum holothuriorum]